MKQERYLGGDGRDWIDKCADFMSPTEFRGAMIFTVGKYYQRLGKKDPILQELAKIEDYKERWKRVEIGNWESERSAFDYVDEEVEILANGS